MKIKKVLTGVTVLVIVLSQMVLGAPRKKEILFPKREYVNRVSKVFFKKVNIEQPLISKSIFFARSQAYRSAYIHLTHFIIKNNYYMGLLPRIKQAVEKHTESFDELKDTISIEHCLTFHEKMKITRLTFYFLVLHTLVDDYNNNRLSGTRAFRSWNILLNLTLDAYKKRKTLEDAAILEISSHFIFFKKYKKWQKRSKKIIKKHKKKHPNDKGDSNCQLVLNH